MLDPLSFVIYIDNISMIIEQWDIWKISDDSTLYSCGEKLTEIKENLPSDTKSILNFFRLNSLKPNLENFNCIYSQAHNKNKFNYIWS